MNLPQRRLWCRAILRTTILSALCVTLAGCGHQKVRDDSERLLRQGKLEQAVSSLQTAVDANPGNAVLRAGLLDVRRQASSRLMDQASMARSAGRLDEAEALLQRVIAIEETEGRARAMLQEIAVERRQRKLLAEAETLIEMKQPLLASRVVADALKDNPRQSDLVQLQRRLEAELRQVQVRALQQGLAETRPVSLDFRDANLRTVLDVVSRNSGINFILDKDIRTDARVTVFLRSARVEDAIDLIVSTNQLAKKVLDPQTILVYPNTPEKRGEHQEQVVRVFYLASADAKNAAAFLRSMIKVREPYVDERSNMLAIRDAPEVIELAERLIALYDANEPEVLMELEVIEVRSNRLTNLGIQFPNSFSLTPLAPAGNGGLTLGNVREITRDRIGLSIGGVLVNLRREAGDFTTLANPRIRARNKEKAKILVGDRVPVITATTGVSGFVADTVTYIDVGLKLDAEPTIYADDEVAIKLNLEVSAISSQVRTSSGSLAYQIGTRNASTVLRLKDGETQFLAGLISKEDRSAANRVPGLGDLPIAGRLFSSQQDETNKTELVLAVTPRVLRNLRRPSASESELWVGTELSPGLRPVGGRFTLRDPSAMTTPQPGQADASGPPSTAVPTAPLPTGGPLPVAPSVGAGAEARPLTIQSTRIDLQWTGPKEVRVGEEFEAALQINSNEPLRGAPVQLRFDTTRLALLDVAEGEFFRRGGAITSFTKSVEQGTGLARAGILRNEATTAQGQGTVLKVKLKALSPGPAQLTVFGFDPVTVGPPAPSVNLPVSLGIDVR